MSSNKRSRVTIVASLAFAAVLLIAGVAYALSNTVTHSNTNQTVTVTLTEPSHNTFNCGGRNDTTNGANVDTIGVSYICQYKDNGGTWHDFEAAKAHTESNASSTGTFVYTDNPCAGGDGGLNLPGGNWNIRAQADGWTINNGNRLDFKGSGAAMVGTITAECA